MCVILIYNSPSYKTNQEMKRKIKHIHTCCNVDKNHSKMYILNKYITVDRIIAELARYQL